MHSSPETPVLTGLLGAAAAIVLVSFLFRMFSGWHHLQRLYPSPPHPIIGFGSWRTLHLGWSAWLNWPSYIGANSDGLLLRAFPLFALLNRPVLTPWGSIHIAEVRSHLLYPVELRFVGSPIAPLRLPENLAAQLAAASGGHWPQSRVA